MEEVAFNTIPQEVRNWIEKDLKWKREDLDSFHALYSSPIVVTVAKGQEKHKQRFTRMNNSKWKKVKGE
jgi:hypothetical protein